MAGRVCGTSATRPVIGFRSSSFFLNLERSVVKCGVIGLGAMGFGMAMNLHKAGHLHRVWNRTAEKAKKLAGDTGTPVSESIPALAADCELIITCVSRDADVIEVVEKIAGAAKAGTIVVDTSTVSSDTAIQAEKILKTKGIAFLDCPVSGGVEGARKGTLSMMVGGDAEVLEKARPALSAIASNIVHIGPTGSGQACKAVNQIMCAGINQAVTEALAFGERMKLNMDRVLDVVTRGAAGNWFLEHRGRTMLAGSYDVGFKVNLHHKDLGICMQMAARNPGTKLPLVEQTVADYEKLMAKGYGDEDISSLYRLKRPADA
jgi:3-hydroxyisobutyrate dehydrogenase